MGYPQLEDKLRNAAQEIVEDYLQATGDPQPVMVNKAVLLLEVIDGDGSTATLHVATDHPLWDLLGLLEASRLSLKDHIRLHREDNDG